MEMNKKYAIFDMDGTLIDSMKYWKNLGREYLSKYGITENLDEIMEKMHMTPAHSIEEAIEKAKNLLNKEDISITAIPDGVSVIVQK